MEFGNFILKKKRKEIEIFVLDFCCQGKMYKFKMIHCYYNNYSDIYLLNNDRKLFASFSFVIIMKQNYLNKMYYIHRMFNHLENKQTNNKQ